MSKMFKIFALLIFIFTCAANVCDKCNTRVNLQNGTVYIRGGGTVRCEYCSAAARVVVHRAEYDCCSGRGISHYNLRPSEVMRLPKRYR